MYCQSSFSTDSTTLWTSAGDTEYLSSKRQCLIWYFDDSITGSSKISLKFSIWLRSGDFQGHMIHIRLMKTFSDPLMLLE